MYVAEAREHGAEMDVVGETIGVLIPGFRSHLDATNANGL